VAARQEARAAAQRARAAAAATAACAPARAGTVRGACWLALLLGCRRLPVAKRERGEALAVGAPRRPARQLQRRRAAGRRRGRRRRARCLGCGAAAASGARRLAQLQVVLRAHCGGRAVGAVAGAGNCALGPCRDWTDGAAAEGKGARAPCHLRSKPPPLPRTFKARHRPRSGVGAEARSASGH
jgi:hypothetical protein